MWETQPSPTITRPARGSETQMMGLYSNCSWVHAQKPRRRAQVGINHTRGLRSRQAGSAHPDTFIHPKSRTRGLPRRQPAKEKSYPGAAQSASRLRAPGRQNKSPQVADSGAATPSAGGRKKHSRGLRSRQTGSADTDEQLLHPNRQNGKKRRNTNKDMKFRPGLVPKPAQNSGARYGEHRHQNKHSDPTITKTTTSGNGNN